MYCSQYKCSAVDSSPTNQATYHNLVLLLTVDYLVAVVPHLLLLFHCHVLIAGSPAGGGSLKHVSRLCSHQPIGVTDYGDTPHSSRIDSFCTLAGSGDFDIFPSLMRM